MDVAIQMKSVDLLVKLLKRDVATIPPYGYKLQKKPLTALRTGEPLPRATAEEAGIPSEAIERFYREVGAEADSIAAHGMAILRHGKLIACASYAPYSPDIPHMLYSMSKSITATAIGIAVDEGHLALDERLIDIFPEYTSSAQEKILRAHTVKHLLTMSTGSRFNEVGSMLDNNWAKMFMESIPKFEAGSAFEYNSLNSYMLAAIIAKRTGMTLTEYLTPRLFKPLGICYHEWEKCPEGIEKGGWGLALTLEDAAKIGQLYLNHGMWNGRRIVSEAWCREATRKQIDTPHGEMKHGYGYQIWMSDDEGGYQFNGAFGQYVLVMPKYDAVISIFSGSANLFAQGTLMEHVARLFEHASDVPLDNDRKAERALRTTLSALRYEPRVPEGLGTDADEFEHIASKLDGREYVLSPNMGGLFPQTLQGVHANYTQGTNLIRFERAEGGLRVTFYEFDERNSFVILPTGGFSYGAVTLRGERQLTGVRALWSLEPGSIRLSVLASFLECPDTCRYDMTVEENRIALRFDEYPGLDRVVDMLFELVNVSQIAYLKKMLPEVRRENLEERVRHMTIPVAEGVSVKHNDANDTPRLTAAELASTYDPAK